MISGFKNVQMYVDGKFVKKSLTVENGKIINFKSGPNHLTIDEKLYLVPGFIDEHIHGANGCDSMNGKRASLLTIATNLAKEGVTSFLATTMTQTETNIIKALNAIRDYIDEDVKEGAEVLGVHLEGPFISKVFKGAQPEHAIRKCDRDLLEKFNHESGDNIRLVTFAYEENGKEMLDYMVAHGITASIGHTNATSDEALEAIQNGASCATHTYNAMKGLHHREAGTLGAVMISDNVYAELIADLIHVSKTAIKLLVKTKTVDKMIAITDAMEAKNLKDGTYELGGQEVYVKDGSARLKDGTLAGSILNLNKGLRNIKEAAGISLEDTIKMATINPAKNLGISHFKGSIALGKDADFVVIDEDFNIYLTVRGGNIVYQK